jgi:hypothetical protein
MSEFNISIESGTSKRLPVGNKWSEKDIIVTATGGTEDLNDVLTEQDTLIAELKDVLKGKASRETQAYGFLDDTLTTIDSEALIVVQYACRYLKNLEMVNLPECTNIGGYAFQGCSNLTSINAPKLTTVASYSFNDSGLVSIDFPSLNPVTSYSFSGCAALKKADFGRAGTIGGGAFLDATVLETLILRKSDEICKLNNVNSLNNTPIANGTGYIYVPSALVDSYKSATNWSTYAAQIRAIEDYPDITGG